jgi:hypothetical protein
VIEEPLTEGALKAAFRRLEDFRDVQGADSKTLSEGLTILREGLGITDEIIDEIAEWAESYAGDRGYGPPLMLGLMVGLIAADHEA